MKLAASRTLVASLAAEAVLLAPTASSAAGTDHAPGARTSQHLGPR